MDNSFNIQYLTPFDLAINKLDSAFHNRNVVQVGTIYKNKKEKKDMTNDRAILAGIFTIFVMFVISIYAGQPVQALEDAQISELSVGTSNIICDQPPRDNLYGGIGRSESNPPNGTTINQILTNESGRTTATGVCGTYHYISGWWFNTTEMANLPYDTIMYGASPYTASGGPGGDTQPGGEARHEEENPVVPVPEVATIILVTLGIFGLVIWRKKRK